MSEKDDKKNQRKRSLIECYAEAKKVEICRKNDGECSSGVRKRKMDVRSFRAQFRTKQNKGIVTDDSQRNYGGTDLAVSQLSALKLRETREKKGTNSVREASTVDVGEAKLSNSRTRGSNTEESETPGIKPSVTINVAGEPLRDNTCFGTEVSPEIDIAGSNSIGVSTGFNVVKKSNQSIASKNLDPICDSVKKRRKVVDNGVNPSPGQELKSGRGIQHANQSLPVPAMGGGTSNSSPASSLQSHDNISLRERNQDLSVESLISNEQNSIHVFQTAELERKSEILALESWEEIRLLLEKHKSVEASVIRQIYGQNVVTRVQKLKMLDYETSRKLEEHKKLIEADLKDVKAKHIAEITEDSELEAQWLTKCRGTETRTSDGVPICNFPATVHARNKVVNDSQTCDASVSDLPVEAVGFTTPMESDHLRDELVNDLHTSDGSQSDASVHGTVDTVACNIPSGTIRTLTKINNLNSTGDNRLDVCVDAAKEAEGCTVHKEIGNAPGISTSEGIEVTVTDRTSVLRDEGLNEVACPSYSPANDKFLKHPRSDGETHEKLPSASNVVDHHYIQRTSSGERHDKLSSGEANESVPVPEDAHEKLRSSNDPYTNTTVIQSNGADDSEDRVISSNTPELLGNQKDDADSTDPYPDQTTLVAHPHEVIDLVDHAISAPMRQASTDELPQCAISVEIQGPNQDKHSQFVESIESAIVAQGASTHELTPIAGSASSGAADNGLTTEPNYPIGFEQRNPSTEHVTLGPESGGPAYQIFSNGCAPLRVNETTHQVEEPRNHTQHQPQVRENLFEAFSSDIRNPNIGNSRHSLPSISNQGDEPTSGLCASFHCADQPSVVDGGSNQRINRAVIQAANRLGLSNSHLSLHADPLQMELEKLRKGIEQTTKGHEDLKSQLRSDCEKEIAEVVAEIRSKYEAQVRDAGAIFQQKQNDLNSNVNKVLLHKILADAVSTKWLDVSSSGFRRQQGSIQQRQHRSVQPTLEPANVGLSSAGSTPAAPQNTSLNLLAGPRAAALSVVASSRPPIIKSISRPQTNARVGADIRAVAPHLQYVRSDFRATAPHLQVAGADIPVSAPHLQPFRPPVSVPAPHHSLPQSVTNQPLVNRPSLTPR